MKWFQKLANEASPGDDPGDKMEFIDSSRDRRTYRMNVLDDEFLHFTTRERAAAIIQAGSLSIDSSTTLYGIFAVSLIFGMHLPKVHRTGFGLKGIPDSDIVALKFKTDTIPMGGSAEEVSWLGDVNLINPSIIEMDEADTLLKAIKPPVPFSPDDDMVIYTDREHIREALGLRFGPDTGEGWSGEIKAHEMLQQPPPVNPGEGQKNASRGELSFSQSLEEVSRRVRAWPKSMPRVLGKITPANLPPKRDQ